jgi:hypothetical protein
LVDLRTSVFFFVVIMTRKEREQSAQPLHEANMTEPIMTVALSQKIAHPRTMRRGVDQMRQAREELRD